MARSDRFSFAAITSGRVLAFAILRKRSSSCGVHRFLGSSTMYISPSPSARALHLQRDFGQFVSDFSCLFFGQPNNRTAISPQSCGCSGLSVPNHPALASHSYKIACQDCRAGHRSDVDSFAVEYIADHDRPSSREAPRSKGCACWRAIARQFARSRYFPFGFGPGGERANLILSK